MSKCHVKYNMGCRPNTGCTFNITIILLPEITDDSDLH